MHRAVASDPRCDRRYCLLHRHRAGAGGWSLPKPERPRAGQVGFIESRLRDRPAEFGVVLRMRVFQSGRQRPDHPRERQGLEKRT